MLQNAVAWAEAVVRKERLFGVRHERLSSIRASDIPDYYHACARERISDPYFQGVTFFMKPGTHELDTLRHSIVRTNYIPLYRLQSKAHFCRGDQFPKNWEESERKRRRNDRYSPLGTEAHYFGLTLAAAENEALYYGDGVLDPTRQLVLVLDVCLDGILDLLSGKLKELWKLADLQPVPAPEMYLRLMDPATDNPITNTIGRWARKQPGVTGLIYPSARRGQLEWMARGISLGLKPVPIINRVSVGSHLDRTFHMQDAMPAAAVFQAHDMRARGEFPVSAEANIALFGSEQLSGGTSAVFYQTCHLDERGEVEGEDDRGRQRNFLIRFGSESWFDRK